MAGVVEGDRRWNAAPPEWAAHPELTGERVVANEPKAPDQPLLVGVCSPQV
jgi:hypothetical protein